MQLMLQVQVLSRQVAVEHLQGPSKSLRPQTEVILLLYTCTYWTPKYAKKAQREKQILPNRAFFTRNIVFFQIQWSGEWFNQLSSSFYTALCGSAFFFVPEIPGIVPEIDGIVPEIPGAQFSHIAWLKKMYHMFCIFALYIFSRKCHLFVTFVPFLAERNLVSRILRHGVSRLVLYMHTRHSIYHSFLVISPVSVVCSYSNSALCSGLKDRMLLHLDDAAESLSNGSEAFKKPSKDSNTLSVSFSLVRFLWSFRCAMEERWDLL